MSSQASTPSSPSSITEEIPSRIIAAVVKGLDTEELVEYLQRKDLIISKFFSLHGRYNSNVETMTNANEATRCEFISAILRASIAITKKITSQDITIVLQKDIQEKIQPVEIKALEDLLKESLVILRLDIRSKTTTQIRVFEDSIILTHFIF
ncbi:hypothetical protein C1646_771412 [Rhizophagus diaphanus]|nr:hypothetical protein C1646_771412 [Rhizophagus diaphanus] [Rhizophagus sp. MUCL 43196]